MGIKLSGMISGMDTDAMVKELMSAQSLKKTKIENKKTLLNWKQEVWKDLNTKLKDTFMSKSVNKMRIQGSYNTKKVSSSDETKAGATASNSAAKGAHSLEIAQLASAQYLTGGKINRTDGATVISTTKLADLGIPANTVITIKAPPKPKLPNGQEDTSNEQKLTVSATTTISDFVTSCQKAGLNATFDTTQKRLFISSKESGADQKYTITTTAISGDFAVNQESLNKSVGYGRRTSVEKAEIDAACKALRESDTTTPTGQAAYDAAVVDLTKYAKKTTEEDYKTKYDASKAEYSKKFVSDAFKAEAKRILTTEAGVFADETNSAAWLASSDGQTWLTDNDWTPANITANPSGYADALKGKYDTEYKKALTSKLLLLEEGAAYQPFRDATLAARDALMVEIETAVDGDYLTSSTATPAAQAAITQIKVDAGLEPLMSSQVTKATTDQSTIITDYVRNSKDLAAGSAPDGSSLLTNLGLAEILGDRDFTSTTPDNVSGLTMSTAKNAKFTLDGAAMEETSNSFTINFIKLDLKAVTTDAIKIAVENDVDSTYNMVKDFVKEFNIVIKEMNERYNIKAAKGYDPLTDEQKQAMTDDEIEKWDTKIKDSLLRRDSTLFSISDSMKSVMMRQITVDGKTCSLASLGIKTSSDYTEKGLLHIYGDAEDSLYSDEDNKLKESLEKDPEFVMKVLSEISQGLYDEMNDKMGSNSLSSSLTFYNDKQMDRQNREYSTEIKTWEKKLTNMEARYYKQFTAMEKALSKLQNQSSSLSSMLGLSS